MVTMGSKWLNLQLCFGKFNILRREEKEQYIFDKSQKTSKIFLQPHFVGTILSLC